MNLSSVADKKEYSPRQAAGLILSRRQLLAAVASSAAFSVQFSCSGDSSDGMVSSSPGDVLENLHFASLREVARLIESRQVSPLQLTQSMLDRISALDSRLNSYATVMAEQAVASAQKAEREIRDGNYRGPLHGVPVAVKDLCYTKGVRTMGGLNVLADFVPDYDATVISRLEAAGAVLLGKLNLTEGAMGGYHRDFKIPVNPWRSDLWAGASSSGSGVAVAAGLCFAALGTDTGGSIRYPSMANGTVGLKPTYGRVSRHGVLPLAESLDHVGPMARRVVDAAIVLEAIAGFDPKDPTSLREPVADVLEDLDRGVAGLHIGFDRRYASDGVDVGLVAAIENALEELQGQGAEIVDVQMPDVTGIEAVWFSLCAWEARAAHAESFPARSDEYGGYLRDFLSMGAEVSEAAYVEASWFRAEFNRQFRALLSTVDALAAPSGGVPFALPHDVQYGPMAGFEPYMTHVQLRFSVPADLAGTPTLSIPCGSSQDGLPYTLQLMGSHLGESMLCRIGHAYEEATPWHNRRPNV